MNSSPYCVPTRDLRNANPGTMLCTWIFSFFNNFNSGTFIPWVHMIKLNLHTHIPSSESSLPLFVVWKRKIKVSIFLLHYHCVVFLLTHDYKSANLWYTFWTCLKGCTKLISIFTLFITSGEYMLVSQEIKFL